MRSVTNQIHIRGCPVHLVLKLIVLNSKLSGQPAAGVYSYEKEGDIFSKTYLPSTRTSTAPSSKAAPSGKTWSVVAIFFCHFLLLPPPPTANYDRP